jgi:exodeoxyribonuclease V beta subunit
VTETYRIRKPATLAEIPHDNHAVIEASAGTGKTYTIEHMVIDLLLGDDELRISQILIVTFTERATFELTARIRKLLQGIVDADPQLLAKPYDEAWEIGKKERRRLQKALSSFDMAPIHTIHGFCHRVLTENAFQNHRLFDQDHTDFDVLFERVFKEALRREFAYKPELRAYLEAWLEAKNPAVDKLQRMLSRCVRSRAEIRPKFDEAALASALAAFDEHEPAEIVKALKAELKDEGVHHSTIRAVGTRVSDILAGLHSWRDTGDVVNFLALAGDKKVYEYLDEKLEAYAFAGPTGQLVRQAFDAVVPLEAAVAEKFLPTLERMLREYKEEEGHFSYDDMLSFVWESLDSTRGTSLVEVLRQRYRYALIDEFQDTDDLQWKIFRRIFHESDRQNIFYLIGDPKQAIYSFRGADVYTYLDAKQTVLDAGGALVRLGTNYRSSRHVVSAYNHIFDQSVEPSFFTGEIGYEIPVDCNQEDWQVRRAQPDQQSDQQADQLVSPIKLVQLIDEDLNSMRVRQGFAAYFASEIRQILDDGRLIVTEDATSEPREVSARDIFILTRSRSEGRFIAEHLRQEGVPYAFFKQDGLFQTPEAHHIYDLLQAVAQPHDRSKRLKAWLTPFFGLDLEELADTDDLSDTEPLLGDLFDWKRAADKRWFESLFNDILASSGLLRREIFTKTSERELTNYLHIFEILLEEANRSGSDLGELILRLKAFIEERQSPGGENGNVQRLETDRDAVQIMTMHKSKGLEADVVFIYGGFGRAPAGSLHAFHDDGLPVLHIGDPPKDAKEKWEREQREEEQRLMYVALTRAKSRIYLPYVGFEAAPDTRDYDINGPYAALLGRLDTIVSELPEPVDLPRFELDRVEYAQTVRVEDVAAQMAALSAWQLPEQVPIPFGEGIFHALRSRRHTVSSYSKIKNSGSLNTNKSGADQYGADQYGADQYGADQYKADGGQPVSELLPDSALPGGKRSGVFLHELVETLDIERARAHDSLETWLEDAQLERSFRASMRQYGVGEEYLDFCKEIVWRSVKTPLRADGLDLPCVAHCERTLNELEFLYPIPESSHPAIDQFNQFNQSSKLDQFEIDRGYIKGYIDLLFETGQKYYFADWKSDILADYGAASLDAHVAERYSIQATLYSLAVVKFLGLHDEQAYEDRFGGYLYLFMRGMDADDGLGVYFRRPSWEDIRGYEAELRDHVRF